MKKLLLAMSAAAFLCSCQTAQDDGMITIKGKVQFTDPEGKMEIIRRDGFDKEIIGSFDVNPDGTYEYQMKVEKPGVYTLDCQKWQAVSFWAEDEDLEINFRGMDTARIKIKNPPYVYISGGPLNEVMNLYNFFGYRNYQSMIAGSQTAYGLDIPEADKGAVAMKLFEMGNVEYDAQIKYLLEHYSDRPSVLVLLSRLNDVKDAELIDATLSRLQAAHPDYAPVQEFKAAIDEKRYQRERLAVGQPAPDFKFADPDGNQISLSDYKGRIVLVDFWASWCGPCRAEIPHVKKVYEKYHSKGVEVLSVSIDAKREDWLKALQEENMPWKQINAPKAGKDIMKEYQFSGIPYLILVDAEGRIAAKRLRGEATDKAIDELLAK